MTRTLILLRHAKSAWPDGVGDTLRPLADRGRRDAPAAGRWLRDHTADIDLVVCSPALRTRQTWQLVSAELGATPEFLLAERVYDASVDDLVDVVRELPSSAGTVLLIGHNPGLTELVRLLGDTEFELKTSSVAVLRGTADWADIGPNQLDLIMSDTPRG